MVDVKDRQKCRTLHCRKYPSFGVAGTKKAEHCAQHAPDGMVNVKNKRRRTEGCNKIPSFGVVGTRKAEYCAQHAPDEMVAVIGRKKCKTQHCGIVPEFGVAGAKSAERCAQHAPDGMVYIKSRKYRTNDYGKLGVAGTSLTEYCVQQTRPTHGVKRHRMSGVKREIVRPYPAQASSPSAGSRGSRKRERHLDIASTASTRALSGRESAAGAIIMPEIDGQNSPVKRDHFVKTDVQLSV